MSTLSSTIHSTPSPFSLFSIQPPPAKKQRKMTLTQTYFLAHAARAKLSREASRPDHDLRILVGHANMLDSLMLELADAEKEQENWFNQSVRGANNNNNNNNKLSEEQQQHNKHIQWADTVVEEPEEDWDPEELPSDSDSEGSDSDDSDYDEEDILSSGLFSRLPKKQEQQPPSTPRISSREIIRYMDEEDAIEEDDEEDSDELALTRTHSHSKHQPPELLDDSDDSSSDDESLPLSPPQSTIDSFSKKGAVVTSSELYSSKRPSDPSTFTTLSSPESDQSTALFEERFFLPHQPERAAMIEAF
ncbi:hypothetical protein ACJ72_03876 [Emergomyces africanus]|uniref:Protein ECM13 n=1 Tax=Emergomyces africanus TaxID=1955775 RepID=A0A1B7NYC2_9EURO|nr:hypothetical protein ACJ72_03876 [Emergomyces africanus]